MNAAEFLGQYGLTVEQALAWIEANISTPQAIYDVCVQYGLTSAHIAEIIESRLPGITAGAVEDWFDTQGFNGAAISGVAAEAESLTQLINDDYLDLVSAIVSLNDETGILSTEALRVEVIAQTGESAYYDLFSPDAYEGYDDGVFSAEELGLAFLADGLEATSESIESLYYGTLINAFKAIDQTELTEIYTEFSGASEEWLESPEALQATIDLLIGVFEDPADVPIMTDDVIQETIVSSTVAAIGAMEGMDGVDLFSGLFYVA